MTMAQSRKPFICGSSPLLSAPQVSDNVRGLDLAQSRVSETIAKIDAIIDRTTCIVSAKSALESGDFETAARCVQTFLKLEASTAASHAGAQQHSNSSSISGTGGMVTATNSGSTNAGFLSPPPSKPLLGATDLLGRSPPNSALESQAEATAREQRRQLSESKQQLEAIVRKRFAAAVEEEDQRGVERFARLFAPLGMSEEGLRGLVAYLRRVVGKRAREQYAAMVEAIEPIMVCKASPIEFWAALATKCSSSC